MERQKEEGEDSTVYETEADNRATDWLVGDFKADPNRELMNRPGADEIQFAVMQTDRASLRPCVRACWIVARRGWAFSASSIVWQSKKYVGRKYFGGVALMLIE
jgi:hypothetical protein